METTRTIRRSTLAVCVVTLLLAALTFGATRRATTDTTQGVTKDSIKVGIALIDFSAIKDFVHYKFGDTKRAPQIVVDDINKNGALDGRKFLRGFKESPPIP